MKCPRCGSKLMKLGISLVCPHDDYKRIQPSKNWVPELRRTSIFPDDSAWANWTRETTVYKGATYYHITITGNTLTLQAGVVDTNTGGWAVASQTDSSIISPQFTNLTSATDMMREFTKIKIDSVTADKKGGRIYFYASNDGGTSWNEIKDNGHTFSLNYGNEGVYGTKQTEYNDLRLKLQFWRPSTAATTPELSEIKIKYNQIPNIYPRRAV